MDRAGDAGGGEVSETPGQVLQRMVNARWGAYVPAGDWSELSDAARIGYAELAAAFIAEMRCVRFVPSDAAEVELPFDPDDYPVR